MSSTSDNNQKPNHQLREIQDKQLQVSRRLQEIQNQLFRAEEEFLEVTHSRGNHILGWDNFMEFKPRSESQSVSKRRFKASDRVFSFSSLTSPITKGDIDKDEFAKDIKKWVDFFESAIDLHEAKKQKRDEV